MSASIEPTPESPRMPDRPSGMDLEQDVCVHVFTVSAAMVGVCLTVIGLVRIVIAFRKIDTLADDLLALDSFLFLISCLSAYWALRTRNARRMRRVERLADSVFILAMILMVCICGFITFAIAHV
jgi:hypothetical protein